MRRSDLPRVVALLGLVLPACQGDGSDIGPKLPPLPGPSCKVVVLDDLGRGVVGARVAVGGAVAFTGRNGRGDLFAAPRGRQRIDVDGANAAAVAGDQLGRFGFVAAVLGPDLPAVVHLPAFAPGSAATLNLGTQPAATTVTSPNGSGLTVPAGASVGSDVATATTVTLRVGDLEPQHVPGELPPPTAGALLTGAVFCIDPPGVTFSPAADLDLADDLGLGGGATATLFHLDPATGEWTTRRTGLAAVAGRVPVPAAVATGGVYVLGVEVPAATVSGRVVLPTGGPVPDALVAVDGARTTTDAGGRFVANAPAALADGSVRSVRLEVFAGGSWLPARVATTAAVALGTALDLGDVVLDTVFAGSVRVQQVQRGRADVLRPARLSAVEYPVALATFSDAQGQAWFEDVPAEWFGFQEGRPFEGLDVLYGQGVDFLDRERRWLDYYQFLQQRPWFVGQRQSRVFLSDAVGGGPVRDAALVLGTTPGQGLVGTTDESGTFFVDRAVEGRATGTLRTQRGGQTLVSAFSIHGPNGDHLELALQRLLAAPLAAFDRHGLVAGVLLGADPAREHRLRATRRLELQDWWNDVVEGIAITPVAPLDVDPAVTHAAFAVGLAVGGGHLAATELTTPGGVATLQKVGLLVDLVPEEGATVARDLNLDLDASTPFVVDGALAGADPVIDVTQLSLALGLQQPSDRVVDVARDLRGNHAASGDDLQFTLPALTGELADHRWLALLQGEFASGGATVIVQSLYTLPASAPRPLPALPTVTAPAPGATVPAAGFTVEFQLPAGARYGLVELRSAAGAETLLWQAMVPPTLTQFVFVALPTPAATPLVAGRTYTLTVSAFFGDGVLDLSDDPYRDLSTFVQSIGPAEHGVTQVSRRRFTISTN
jgi:hypothetical protein